MFLPISDTPNPTSTPYVNYLLIAINVAIFLLVTLPASFAQPDLADPLLLEYLQAIGARGAVSVEDVLQQVSAYDLQLFRYGFRPAEPSLLTLFSAMFLHAGWMHLAGNMLFLWIFGDNVEHRLGSLRYLLVYLGTGVASTLFFSLFVFGSQVPLVGASGAISGVLGCYFLWFPRNQVKTVIFPFIMWSFMIPARFVLGFYLVVANLIPFLLNGGDGAGVAHGAHIGGFLAGLGMAGWIDSYPGRSHFRGRPSEGAEAVEVEPVEGGAEADIAELVRRGEGLRAASLFFSLGRQTERSRVDAVDILMIGAFLHGCGDYDRALSLYRRFIAERPTDPYLDRAYLGAGKALIHKPRCNTAAYQYFLSAVDLAETGEVADEARMYLRAIEGREEEG